MDAGTSEAITTGLTTVFTALFGYIGYRLSKNSRCCSCNEYLPVKDLRWKLFVTDNTTGKLQEKACCNRCFQQVSTANSQLDEPALQKAQVLLEEATQQLETTKAATLEVAEQVEELQDQFEQPSPEKCSVCGVTFLSIDANHIDVYGQDVVVCPSCLSKKPPTEKVMLRDLLSDSFLAQQTGFSSFSDLTDRYGEGLEEESDLHTQKFNSFIKDNSEYASFQEMLDHALDCHRISMTKRYFNLD